MRYKDKVAIVTGSTSGIGRAIAKLLAEEGAKVVVTGRNQERGTAVADSIKEEGGEALFVLADLVNQADIDKLVDTTISQYGKIDVLVNNAGIQLLRPMEEYPQEKWDMIMNVNLRSVYLLIKKAMPHIIESKGNIVNIGSIAAIKSLPGAYAYCPSKAALVSLTKLLATDYAKKGVRVNAVCPGVFYTEILGDIPQEVLDRAAAATPLGYLGHPVEIAKAVAFMASDDASYITGQALYVDGGRTI